MTGWLVQNHDALEGLGGLAAFFSLMALTIGGLFALVRFRADRQHQFVQAARILYYDYARLAIDNPQYFCGYWSRSNLSAEDRARYIRFVAYMINGIEDIIHTDPDPKWREALKMDFRFHRDFLKSKEFRDVESSFFEDTRRMIREVLAEQGQGSANA